MYSERLSIEMVLIFKKWLSFLIKIDQTYATTLRPHRWRYDNVSWTIMLYNTKYFWIACLLNCNFKGGFTLKNKKKAYSSVLHSHQVLMK